LIAFFDLGRRVRVQKNKKEYDQQRVHRDTAQVPKLPYVRLLLSCGARNMDEGSRTFRPSAGRSDCAVRAAHGLHEMRMIGADIPLRILVESEAAGWTFATQLQRMF
jgi:hypothetical protein